MKANKKVVFKHYITGFAKESDMEVVTTDTIQLKVPEKSKAVLIKNLYLSCDPYVRILMTKSDVHDSLETVPTFVPGSVINLLFLQKDSPLSTSRVLQGSILTNSIFMKSFSYNKQTMYLCSIIRIWPNLITSPCR